MYSMRGIRYVVRKRHNENEGIDNDGRRTSDVGILYDDNTLIFTYKNEMDAPFRKMSRSHQPVDINIVQMDIYSI